MPSFREFALCKSIFLEIKAINNMPPPPIECEHSLIDEVP